MFVDVCVNINLHLQAQQVARAASVLEPAVENNYDAERTPVFIKFWQRKHNIMENESPASSTRKKRAQWTS
ncbi:hypothetical protein HF086_008788 [Spodoptera exigua]|uniref:Uncharacterized protein n=1 Tax=Spodoptera exigua TaxID=7107 RepID=A0A922MKL0_SPOEX|nr:hypothetical protein HF086_008788 [Spodoptera exigua]